MLVNKKQENEEECKTLHYNLEGKIALELLKEIEAKLDELRTKLKHERTHRWRSCVDNSWGHTNYIYKWIR
eukprot:6803477-Heterocapsa_arctica.AAC.1